MKNVCFVSSSLSHASYSLVSTRARSDRLQPCACVAFASSSRAFFFIYTHTYIYILACSVSLGLALSLIRRPKWKREERTRERALFKLWNPIAAGEREKKSACNEKQPLEFLLVKIPILLFFPLLLFLGLKTWSLAPVFMVCSFCNYLYCYCYCSIFVVFENRLLS